MCIVTGFLTGVLANIATDELKRVGRWLEVKHPSIVSKIMQATQPEDKEAVFQEIKNTIEAAAGTGSIEINNALLEAIRAVAFDHNSGAICIADSTVRAEKLETGGGTTATGRTTIGENTTLQSQGTSIKTGTNSSITITGNAKINQT